ncbi:hypothetical protein FJZ40_03420 [Candidatus Shapirobacteria bacterium]|nr:hypothetical protein [Candidatus Shapirobacteria bacterium]
MKILKVILLVILAACCFRPQEAKAIIIPPQPQVDINPKPFLNLYTAKPGDTLWKLARQRTDKGRFFPDASPSSSLAVTNAIKNAEIIINGLEKGNKNLVAGGAYQLLSEEALASLIYAVSKSVTLLSPQEIARQPELIGSAEYLLANPASNPNWQELRGKLAILYPGMIVDTSPPLLSPPLSPKSVAPTVSLPPPKELRPINEPAIVP